MNTIVADRYERVESGCWEWKAVDRVTGYGQRVSANGRLISPHRLAYEEAHGEIPEGLEIDHTCENPCCVNPDHLEAVTHLENVRRSRRTRLTLDDQSIICASSLSGRELAKLFGVSPARISQIRNA